MVTSAGVRSAALVGAFAALVLVSTLVPAFVATPAAATGGDSDVTIDRENGTVTVANGTSQVISGTADLRKGTELIVRVRSAGDTEPRFIISSEAVVTGDGTWAVAFDFSKVHAPGTFHVSVMDENGTVLAEAEGDIVECEGDCTDPTPADTPTPLPEQTPTATPTDGPDPAVTFDRQAVTVERGGVAAIPLQFTGTDTATVVVGNESASGYELTALVEDADGDGEVVVYVDTGLAGRSGQTVSVSGGDSVTVRGETSLSSALEAGTYDLRLYAGDEADGEPTTLGTLVVTEPADESTESDASEGTDSPTTTTERPAEDRGLGGVSKGVAVSLAFLVGGAVLGAILLRD